MRSLVVLLALSTPACIEDGGRTDIGSGPELTADQHYCSNQAFPKRAICGACVCCIACTPDNTLAFRQSGSASTITHAGGVIDHDMIVLAGYGALEHLGIEVPAQVGTHSCASDAVIGFDYVVGGEQYYNVTLPPRPPCEVTVSAVPAIGGRITGTFVATVSSQNPDDSLQLELSAGAFDVERAAP